MTVAAASSVLSTLAFVGYLLLPHVTSQPRTHYTLLYGVGIAGLVIAEACQLLGVVTLIGQWISHTNPQKKPKELAILLLSLIPYMAVVIFLIILVVYLRTQRQDPTSEKTRDAACELKKQAVDTIIDVGAEASHSQAESSAAPASNRGATQHANRSSLQQAVSRVVGPSTGKTVSNVAQGFVVFTFVAFMVATVAIAGVVLPAHRLAPLQSLWMSRASSSGHPMRARTPARLSLAGTWSITTIKCTSTGDLSTSCQHLAKQPETMTIQQRDNALTIIFSCTSCTTTREMTLSGRTFSGSWPFVTQGQQCAITIMGSVISPDQLSMTQTQSCTGSFGPGSAELVGTASRISP
jgi:hypothetical protein